MNQETKFKVGDTAHKTKGYKFPCTIVGVFETIKGDIRVVGEMDEYGLLHIFNEDQLDRVEQKGMNKEKYNQIIDEVYENYSKEYEKGNSFGLCLLVQKPDRETFINKCKTDDEFSEKWGLKIEERELSLEERQELQTKMFNGLHYLHYSLNGEEGLHKEYDKRNVPRRVITLEYNNETIESYE